MASNEVVVIMHGAKDNQYLWFRCPGCQTEHSVRVVGDHAWQWNGDLVKPTISPSILVSRTPVSPQCHSFVRDGRIEFLSDCDHPLAGQTVDLRAEDMDWLRDNDDDEEDS